MDFYYGLHQALHLAPIPDHLSFEKIRPMCVPRHAIKRPLVDWLHYQ